MTLTAPRARAEREATSALGKAGWAARGVLYIVTAALVAQIAGGRGSEEASQTGAFRTIASGPFGRALLGAMAFGLFAFAAWRWIEAWRQRDDELLERAGYAASGFVYLGLALGAASIVVGGGSRSGGSGGSGGSSDQQAQGFTAELLSWPMGPWLVGGAGLVICGLGAYFLKRGLGSDFMEELDLASVSAGGRRAIEVVGIVGQCARGLVFGLVGWFVVKAAVEFDAEEAKGLDGALHELAAAPEGSALLWAAALGLLTYGVFCLVRARYDGTT